MKKKYLNSILSEDLIINKYLKKLNFNKKGTFNFNNDAAYFKVNKNKKIVFTTDSISENIDFFKNDNPKSIANKIITANLSDLSAMGATPFLYSLNILLPKYISNNWINDFTNELFKIQKKNNFYLIGGDLSKSNKLSISSTFLGYSQTNKIVSQNNIKLNNDIWVTGNIGDSYIGLQILKEKLIIKNKIVKKYFLNKYYYPKHCNLGSKISRYVQSMKDISDGFIGDLKKMLNNKYGAKLNINKIPLSLYTKDLVNKNFMNKNLILNSGDDYQLIIISKKKFRNNIFNISKKNNIKLTRIGSVTKNLQVTDDSNNLLNIPRNFDHFL